MVRLEVEPVWRLDSEKAQQINCLPAETGNLNERYNLYPEIRARCQQAVTVL
jgi:hypothetical protein